MINKENDNYNKQLKFIGFDLYIEDNNYNIYIFKDNEKEIFICMQY